MAIQTLLPYDLNARNAASRASQDLATGLEGLLQNKMSKMQQRQQATNQAKAFEAAGIPSEQASLLAMADPQTQQLILKNYLQAAEGSGLNQALAQLSGEQAPQQPMQQMTGSMQGQPQDMIMRNLMQGFGQQQRPQQSQQGVSAIPGSQVQPQSQGNSLADILQRPRLNPQHRLKVEELKQKQVQHEEKLKQAHSDRLEKREDTLRKDVGKISKHAERAKQDIHTLHQIKVANDSGSLIQGPKRKLLEQFGLEDYFTNTSTQYAAKNIQRMITGATEAFGTGRLTNFLAEAYEKALPRLINTKDGMDLLIENLILEKSADVALNDEIRKIKAEYRSKDKLLPTDIEDIAREQIEPKIEALQRESIANIERVISGESKSSFESLPKASDYNGKIITDTKTGTRYKSNGLKWVKDK